jgi:cation transport ATPase
MSHNPSLRVSLGADGVSVWSHEIFGNADTRRLRTFLERTFAVNEVERVDLRRSSAVGRIRYGSPADPTTIWKKLGRVLSSGSTSSEGPDEDGKRLDAGHLFLDGPPAAPVRVTRVGDVLSTWRVRHVGEARLSVWHPALLNQRTLAFRLEEQLAGTFGVESFRVSVLSGGASIRFDDRQTSVERLFRELEKAWPAILEGLDGPPSPRRLVASLGLVGLSYYGQYVAPAVRPFAVASMTVYALPNLINAVKDLRHGKIGLPALYSTGVTFMLISGFPFTASVMAAFMQIWPHLTRRKLVAAQRRLFATQRRRPTWARRLSAGGTEVDVPAEDLRKNELIVVRRGESIPADGAVDRGSAAVSVAPFGSDIEDKLPGDTVTAGSIVHDGMLTIRVTRAGNETSASHVDSVLPRAWFPELPSSREAERIANRNARPALAVSLTSLAVTRVLPPSQAVLRPDYATGPRISAQLCALRAIAEAWQEGILVRDPAVLDRLPGVETLVIDDTARVDRRGLEVAEIRALTGTTRGQILDHALLAHRGGRGERARALAAFAPKASRSAEATPEISSRAGVVSYRDDTGSEIEIATQFYLSSAKLEVPSELRSSRPAARGRRAPTSTTDDAALGPLWVLRDGRVIGSVSFTRAREVVGRSVVTAIRELRPKLRIVYLSRGGRQAARAVADELGIELFHSALSHAGKLSLLRALDGRILWIGDGSDPRAKDALSASTVSVSVAPLAEARQDSADLQLVHADLPALPGVLELGREHSRRLAADYRFVYTANLLGAAGAFLANLTALQTGLLSNVATAAIYARHARALERLAVIADQRQASLARLAPL